MEKRIQTGVILARFQPVHNGHMALIEKACNENDEVLVFIGSVDKLNVRNPIPWNIRREMLEAAIEEAKKTKPVFEKVKIYELSDLSDESQNTHEWGFYLYTNIVEKAASSYFTIYYSDGFEIITSWFPGWLLRKYVSMSLMARGGCVDGISATAVRKAILDDDFKTLKEYVPTPVFDNVKMLKSFIQIYNK